MLCVGSGRVAQGTFFFFRLYINVGIGRIIVGKRRNTDIETETSEKICTYKLLLLSDVPVSFR